MEDPRLYELAKEITTEAGMDYYDPRTGKKTPAKKATPKRRCDYCKRAVGTKDDAMGATVYVLHSPPGGGYCVGSDQPAPKGGKP